MGKKKEIVRKGRQRVFSDFNTVIQREAGLFNVVRGLDVLAVGLSFDEASSYIAEHRSEEEEFSLNDTFARHRSFQDNKQEVSFEAPKMYGELYVLPFKIGG